MTECLIAIERNVVNTGEMRKVGVDPNTICAQK